MVTKRRSAEAAREQICEAALDLFVAHGYGATSLEDIAGRLGLTRQAVLYHFRTKEELLRHVLDPYLGRIGSLLEQMQASDPPTPAQRRAMITALVTTSLPHRRAIALLNRFTTESRIAGLGPVLVTLNTQLVRLLAGTAITHNPALRVRVVATLAALSGVMASLNDVPLATPHEHQALIDGCVAILDPRP